MSSSSSKLILSGRSYSSSRDETKDGIAVPTASSNYVDYQLDASSEYTSTYPVPLNISERHVKHLLDEIIR